MILGGNSETAAFVDYVNSLGVITHVLDPNPASPAKTYAAYSYDVDGMDIDRIEKICTDWAIDGVIVGVADILVPSYFEVCRRLSFPCYVNEGMVGIVSSKYEFSKACVLNGLSIIPQYDYACVENAQFDNIDFPVLVKPVDNGAGVGISVCHSPSELDAACKKALENSRSKKLIIERFMSGDDLFAYFTFIDGVPYLSALADRFTSKYNLVGSPVCIGAVYPSRFLSAFMREALPSIFGLFSSLGVQNGVLMLQFFHEDGNFYIYDPGFRLQGEAPHLHLLFSNNFDHRNMLVHFALTGSMYNANFSIVNDVSLGGRQAITVWILLKSGIIRHVSGLDRIERLPSYRAVIQRLHVGDVVSSEMMGTERQVFARIYLQNFDRNQLFKDVSEIDQLLNVLGDSGSMILDSITRHPSLLSL